MQTYVIGFVPPYVGLEGFFNTVRMGTAYRKKLKVGDTVMLMDERAKMIFGAAEVVDLVVAPLKEICDLHAHKNHTELEMNDGKSSERLFALLQKIYGPHIAQEQRKSMAIYLRRTD